MAVLLLLPTRARFARSGSARIMAGVVGGLAERFEVEPFTARLLAILLGLAGGVGIVGYFVAWWLSTDPDPDAAPRPVSLRRTVAAALAVLGLLLTLRAIDLWPGDVLMLPAMAAAAGAALLAGRYQPAGTVQASQRALDAVLSGRISPLRLLIGGLLLVGGLLLMAGTGSLGQLRQAAVSVALALVGLAVVLGPWIGRLLSQLDSERRERIRSEERAAMAAHLHDSVLQTLALIQRGPTEPRRMVRLARRQERELRAWLYGGQRLSGPASLPAGMEKMAEEVEANHDVRVEVVVVGDHPLDERAAVLLAAVGEAMVNAAKHAGVDSIAVYVEVEPERITAFVRDRGRGFDPGAVPGDRHGIADSIRGRVERAGGRVVLTTAPGQGTEVQIQVPS